ncbi:MULTISPECIES: PepSY domain-containing protein [Methylomicrobium]|uniref:Putative membrane protein n=1 Tax=Methylomicrobium album BG8 TaxID=686340 RepID=H8GNK5_METAL|nr:MULTISPECIES: PepSY domain-containing protein [Methylomicrobium]EIC29598.1 putative membrane protein [Methylomicrobium album BG8]
MNAKYIFVAFLAVIAAGAAAQGTPEGDACRKAVAELAKGEIVKMKLKNKNGIDLYEIDVKSPDGVKWEFKCDKATAKILEKEQELPNANHPTFTALKKIDETQARQIALKAQPGTITKVEYEIEKDGTATYEFGIRTSDDQDMEVEVDAATGKIIKTEED